MPEPRQIEDPGGLFSPEERRLAEYLAERGHRVRAVPRGLDKTPDAEIDGERTEFKTPEAGADSSTIRNRVNDSISGIGQARRIIVDARGTGLGIAEARRALARVGGIARGKLDNLRTVGDGYDIARDYR